MKLLVSQLTCFWLLFLFLAQRTLNAQSAFDPVLAQRLQTTLDNQRLTRNLKGISAAVIVPGQGTWLGVSGVSHDTVAIRPDMVFGIGSATKNLIAAAIMKLQEDSLLHLDQPLYFFLPPFPNVDSTVTIRQLLAHTSGIYNYTDNPTWQNAINSNPTQTWQAQDVLSSYIRTRYFAPGASFRYSNTNYLLLGMIVEQVTGTTVAAHLRSRFFTPLQLRSFYMGELETPTGTMPHNWSDPSLVGASATDFSSFPKTAVWTSSAAAGGLLSTAEDLARWAQLLFTGQVVQDTSLRQMLKFRATSGGFSGYGLGTMRFTYQGRAIWGHAGNLAGFASASLFSPADSVAVGVLVNQDVIGQAIGLVLLSEVRQMLAAPAPAVAPLQALQCFPNPGQEQARVRYALGTAGQVQLVLLNALGQQVAVLAEGQQAAGTHEALLHAAALPAGVYVLRLQTPEGAQTQRWIRTK